MLKNVLLAFVLSVITTAFLKAQVTSAECNLLFYGKVIDGETGEPLQGVVIAIPSLKQSIQTKQFGHFYFKNVCRGSLKIECNLTGYKRIVDDINIQGDTNWVVVMHSESCELESVVIKGNRRMAETAKPIAELKGKELDRTRGLSLGESLQQVPGVFAVQTGPTIFKPVIQGMYGQRVLILNNGVRQEGQQWGSEHAPEIDPFVASKITVLKGAQSVRYGADAIGGVVLVEPAPLRDKHGVDGVVSVAGFSNNRQGAASALVNYAPKFLTGLAMRAQATAKQAGNSHTPRYWLQNTGFQELNFSLAAAYTRKNLGMDVFYSQFNTQLGIFTGSHFGNKSDLEAAIARDVPNKPSEFSYSIDRPYQAVQHELFKARVFYNFTNSSKLEIDFARQYNYRAEYDADRPYNNTLRNLPELKFGITTHTINLAYKHNLFWNIRSTIGVSAIRQANTSRSTVGSFFIPNFISYAGGLYLIEEWKKNRWNIEGGIRADYKTMEVYRYALRAGTSSTYDYITPNYSFQNITSSLGSTFQATTFLKLKGTLSTAFRPPNVNELYSNGVHHGTNTFEKGDSTFRSEYAYNATFSAIVQTQKLFADVMIYNNSINNYIFLAPNPGQFVTTIRGTFPLYSYQQINASFTGLDVTLRDSLHRLMVFTSKLSLLRAMNRTQDEGLIMTPPARWSNTISCNMGNWKGIKEPYVALTQLWVAEKTNIPSQADFKAAPKGYMLFHIEAGFTTHIAKQQADWSFAVQNIFNTTYRDYLDRFRYFNDATGTNIIVRLKIQLGKS